MLTQKKKSHKVYTEKIQMKAQHTKVSCELRHKIYLLNAGENNMKFVWKSYEIILLAYSSHINFFVMSKIIVFNKLKKKLNFVNFFFISKSLNSNYVLLVILSSPWYWSKTFHGKVYSQHKLPYLNLKLP